MDFADLDPHQKGILSDDFGVAITTKWLSDRFGGFRKIVDGRRFVLQFPHHLRKKHSSKAKVGPNKCPDFVMQDTAGRWHVLECKGTQTRSYQKDALEAAIPQKHAIHLVGSIKGEQLAAALFIANEESASRTHLKVIDPDDDPIIRLTQNNAAEIDTKADRLAIAQALGAIGLNEMAVEFSLPPDIDPQSELLHPSEAARIRSSRQKRYESAADQARASTLTTFTDRGQPYTGTEVQFEFPPTGRRLPFRSVIVRQGLESSLLAELTSSGPDFYGMGKRDAPLGQSNTFSWNPTPIERPYDTGTCFSLK